MVRQGSIKTRCSLPRESPKSADCRRSSRHHDGVAGLKKVIPFAVIFDNCVIIDYSDILLAIGIPNKFYLFGGGKRCKPPRLGQRLQYRHVATQGEGARPGHITEDGKLGGIDLPYDNRHIGTFDKGEKLPVDTIRKFGGGEPFRLNILHQGERDLAVRPDNDIVGQLLVPPNRDVKQVFRPDAILRGIR